MLKYYQKKSDMEIMSYYIYLTRQTKKIVVNYYFGQSMKNPRLVAPLGGLFLRSDFTGTFVVHDSNAFNTPAGKYAALVRTPSIDSR